MYTITGAPASSFAILHMVKTMIKDAQKGGRLVAIRGLRQSAPKIVKDTLNWEHLRGFSSVCILR